MHQRTIQRSLSAASLVALAVGGLTGCGAADRGDAGPGDTVTHGPTGSATPTPADGSTPGVPGSTITPDDPDDPAGPAECTAADVTASYEADGGAAGTTYGYVVVTNSSDTSCVVEGFGGVSYVGGGDGDQVGAAADRDTTDQAPVASPVTLEPGGSARSQVAESRAGNYPASTCEPTPVDGLRLYLPDETASVFVEHPTTGCADESVHLLRNQAFQPA